MRIGIFGGTFDPVHVGHLVGAVTARDQCRLDRVLLVVANEPWQKQGVRAITAAEVRHAAVAAAVAGHAGLEASRLEIDRGGPSYTVNTLQEVAAAGDELFLIVGADAARGLPTWHDAGTVAALATVVVLNRPRESVPELPAAWRRLDVEMPALDISSTDLRRRLDQGESVDFLIPDAAIAVLVATGRYAGLQRPS